MAFVPFSCDVGDCKKVIFEGKPSQNLEKRNVGDIRESTFIQFGNECIGKDFFDGD